MSTWTKPDSAGYITYGPIPLSNGRSAELYLPKDLAHDECERLCALLRTLVMPSLIDSGVS